MKCEPITVFLAGEPVQIVGAEKECECSHCGRPLKVGVKLAGFAGAFGSDCLARAAAKAKVGSYTWKWTGQGLRERAIIAYKGAAYASRQYGWDIAGPNFLVVLKKPLHSI